MIHLLTCGPSLLDNWPATDFPSSDLVVGVNTSCWKYQVDWACFSDEFVPEGPIIRPRLGYVISQGLKGYDVGRTFDSFKPWNGWAGWCGKQPYFTFPNALAWCLRTFTSEKILIYGMDMSNKGCLGVPSMNFNHGEDRWNSELPFLEHCFSVGGSRIQFKGGITSRLAFAGKSI